ncbi:MAG: outer membrane beta-barrel protein [Bacteroidota bacterium]
MVNIPRQDKGLLVILMTFLLFSGQVLAQSKVDSLTDKVKNEVFQRLKHFTFGFYMDAYYNGTFNSKSDTSNLVPFSSNCPVQNQIRLNVAAIEIGYTSDWVRGKLAIQFGDAPNLLAAPEAQFIKNLRQANFGFRVGKKLWLDFGYFLNPVGLESSWPVLNYLSTVTVGGYYEPGSVLGVKLTWNASNQFWGGVMIGNPYSLAYSKNTRLAALMFIYYQPLPNLTINYNNYIDNQALADNEINHYIVYNNLIVQYNPTPNFFLTGQLDFAVQTNSTLPPDTNEVATMFSGLIQAKYVFLEKYSVCGRFEFFNDYDGFLSGPYYYDNQVRGLKTEGFSLGFEYKPVKIGYIRLEYRHLFAASGNDVFISGKSDNLQSLVFTTGIRF